MMPQNLLPRVRSLHLRHECAGVTQWTVELSYDGKKPKAMTETDAGQVVTCGIGGSASAHSVGKRLGELALEVLTHRNSADRWLNEVVAKACDEYGRNVIDGIAPDCTFSVRAGCLLPMNRLPNADDMATLTMSSVVEWFDPVTGQLPKAA